MRVTPMTFKWGLSRMSSGGRSQIAETCTMGALSRRIGNHCPRERGRPAYAPLGTPLAGHRRRTQASGHIVELQGIRCDAVRTQGARCGRTARILATKYVFARQPDERDQIHHVLRQTHYEIRCPECGVRIQIVKHRDHEE
jgi:DNA-directed RNA polymerase subunit RPC12/RpoP